jgi:excisionase family DNA binding protein
MSVTQAANTLGISRAAVHKAIQQRRLAAQRFGNVVLVSRQAGFDYKRGRSARPPGKSSTEVASHTAMMAKAR